MDSADAFAWFWSGGVVIMMLVSTAWAINDLKVGSVRMNLWWSGGRVSREVEPFEFWLAVGSKLLVLPVGAFMLWFASDMLWR